MSSPFSHRFRFLPPLLIGCLLAAVVLFALPPVPVQAAEAMPAQNLTTAIIQVAKQAMPAVVYIEVTESKEVSNPFYQFQQDPFLRRFFGAPQMPRKFKREIKGLGSGMILDPQGHILTNYHVAGGATKIQVTLDDGSQLPAKLVGGDPKTDLAVIKIEAKEKLHYVTFANSDKVEVGEWVVAIGAPRALEKSVTQGIISAKHRQGITEPSNYQDFLQTDAAINPGNSGGPLLNLRGEVVGVNAAIATESGGFEGIGFTIPSNMASYVSKQLIATGTVTRGWLGVAVQNLNPELLQKAKVESLKGAYVLDVVKGGPADKGGLQKGDVIIGYQGEKVSDAGSLRNAVAQTAVGATAKLTILREGKKKEIVVKIGNLAEAPKFMASGIQQLLGISVRPVTQKEIGEYGLSSNPGVAIVKVDRQGPLGKAGFEVGDIILQMNGQPVMGYDSFVEIVNTLRPGEKVRIFVLDHRTGNTGYVDVQLGP
jgi:serine protease Do